MIHLKRIVYFIDFLLFYLWELMLSNLVVAYDAVTLKHYMKPAVISMPLSARSDLGIFSVANLISMTPGTLSLDVSSDRSTLYIHCMYVDDVKKLRKRLKDRIESKVLRIFQS